MKLLVILILGGIIASLGSGLFYLVSDKDGSGRLVKALTWRIGLSVALFIFLIVAGLNGWISPNA
ncbi:twin transmembrane helix small protein [Lentisalinibacter salinarum]|uniref:twin transmembrane helix small protein n=1 Tax=Lentisalinibacter salinarum TaxID=2992239 RepID=UPI00386B0702